MAIITLSQIKQYKDVSAHLGKKADSAIENAEILDIKPLLGERMYLDMVRNIGDANYKELLNGGEYEYDDFTYTFIGLKRVLIEFAYSRILFFGSESASPVGMVEKLSQDSRHISRDRKKELYTAARQTAAELWKEVHLFLCRKSKDYEYWDVSRTNTGAIRGFKMTHIRG